MAGRPRHKISVDDIEKLAQIGATQREMASFLGVDTNTIGRRMAEPKYRAAYARGDSNFNISLRRKQAEMALKGDRTMLIWLGKQRLEQTDKVETKHGGGVEVSGQVDVRSAIMQIVGKLPEDQRALVARELLKLEKAV